MFKVKAITHHAPDFLKQAYKHGNIIDLMNHERFINEGETYITYAPPKAFRVYKMGQNRVPRYCGQYDTIMRAAFHARLNR
jgi:hypothetical protein